MYSDKMLQRLFERALGPAKLKEIIDKRGPLLDEEDELFQIIADFQKGVLNYCYKLEFEKAVKEVNRFEKRYVLLEINLKEKLENHLIKKELEDMLCVVNYFEEAVKSAREGIEYFRNISHPFWFKENGEWLLYSLRERKYLAGWQE